MTQDTNNKFAAILAAAQAKANNQATPKFAQPKPLPVPENSLKIVDYSDKAFAIFTDKKPSEEALNIFRLHGSFNSRLKGGKGWIFSKRHLATIKAKLDI